MNRTSQSRAQELAELDARMGLTQYASGVVLKGTVQSFHVGSSPMMEASHAVGLERPSASEAELAGLADLVSTQGRRLAELEGRRARSRLLAGLDPELVKVLETKPLAEVKAIIGAIPRNGRMPTAPAAAAAARSSADGAYGLDRQAAPATPAATARAQQLAELDARMGLNNQYAPRAELVGNVQIFHVRSSSGMGAR